MLPTITQIHLKKNILLENKKRFFNHFIHFSDLILVDNFYFKVPKNFLRSLISGAEKYYTNSNVVHRKADTELLRLLYLKQLKT